jgi:hypothetical protein
MAQVLKLSVASVGTGRVSPNIGHSRVASQMVQSPDYMLGFFMALVASVQLLVISLKNLTELKDS